MFEFHFWGTIGPFGEASSIFSDSSESRSWMNLYNWTVFLRDSIYKKTKNLLLINFWLAIKNQVADHTFEKTLFTRFLG